MLNVPVVTLSINHNIKFLGNIKQGLERTISWNKYKPEIATQPNKLDFLLIQHFEILIDFLFFHLNMVIMILTIYSFDKHYMPLVEVKDFNFNALIGNKSFLISQ